MEDGDMWRITDDSDKSYGIPYWIKPILKSNKNRIFYSTKSKVKNLFFKIWAESKNKENDK